MTTTVNRNEPSLSPITMKRIVAPATTIENHERPQRFRRLRRLTIGAILVASLLVDLLGLHSLSWALDGVAVDVYVTWRAVEHWTARRLRGSSRLTILRNQP
jgi:hypothetical protein